MNPKVEKNREQNRLRVKKHRENKRIKLESSLSQNEEQISLSGVQRDEDYPVISEMLVRADDSQAVELQIPRIDNCLAEKPPLGDIKDNQVIDMNNGGVSGSDECCFVDVPQSSGKLASLTLTEKMRIWASQNVAFTKVDSLLCIIHEYHPEVPLSTKTLLKSDLQLSKKIRKFNVSNPSDTSEYVYFGIVCHLLKIVNVDLHKDLILWLKINVDGMSPYHSSPMNFWPILGLIHHGCASYKPFVIAAYYGKGKPYSVDLFLDEFIIELNHLCKEGIVIGERKLEVRLKCFSCDRPARAYLKRVVNHGAYYACERCWVSGIMYLNHMVYPLRDCTLRTLESFLNQENPEHHDGISPLLKLRDKDDKIIDLVKLFMQEFMHAGPLGIMKKLMVEQWFSDTSKMTRENKIIGSLRLVNLADQIPVELQRTTRELNNLSLWKAKEFRLILLYVGPFVLKELLSDDEYKHFLLLYVACRILHSRNLLLKFGKYTKMFLDRFVLLCEIIYGLEFVVLNPHILSHLYEDVVNMGCSISELDAFIFEGYLSELKKCLRSGNRPLAQVCRKIESDLEFNHKKVVSTFGLLLLSHKASGNIYHVTKLKYLNFELTVKKPDNIILMKDGCLVVIKDMICSSLEVEASKLYVLGEKLQIIGSAFDYPVPSSTLKIYSVERKDECELVKYPLSELDCKVMLCEIFELPSDKKKLFTIPLLRMAAS